MHNVPPALGDLRALKRRYSKAMDREKVWHDQLDDAYEYFLPNRNLFNREDKGQKKMDRIFDSTALNAIQLGASKLQEYIAPNWMRWAIFEPTDEVLMLLESGQYQVTEEDIREGLEGQSKIIFDHLNRSNFSTQFYEAALDILIGTGTLRVDEGDSENPLVFSAVPQKGIAFEEGPYGTVETHWRERSVKARNIEREYPGVELSPSIKARVDNSPDDDLKVHDGVVYDADSKTYYGLMWFDQEDHLSWLEDYQDSSPWVTARYFKVAGEVRGRGPALQALPDVRSLNKAKEFILQKAAIDIVGMYTAVSDGVTNPYNMTIAPGVVIPVGSNDGSNPSLRRLDTNTNLQIAEFALNDLKTDIKVALFNDVRDPNGPVRSATEVAIEARELAKRIGSAFGRLQTELLIPILQRVAWILARRGLIQPVKLGGRDVQVKFVSPLARAQDMEDLASVSQAIQFVGQTAGPEFIRMAYRLEHLGKWAAQKTGMPTELVRPDEERERVMQAGAEAMQGQMAAGKAPEAQPPMQEGQGSF
jgi:hypothetical protein